MGEAGLEKGLQSGRDDAIPWMLDGFHRRKGLNARHEKKMKEREEERQRGGYVGKRERSEAKSVAVARLERENGKQGTPV